MARGHRGRRRAVRGRPRDVRREGRRRQSRAPRSLSSHRKVRYATIRGVPELTRRRLIAGGVPLLGAGALAARRLGRRPFPVHAGPRGPRGPRRRPRELPRRRRRRPRRQRLRPARDRARLRLGHDVARERPRRARVGAGRGRQGDRGHAGREVRRLDLQRAHPRARRCGRARASGCGSRFANGSAAPAHDPLPRHPPGRSMDGVPGARRGADRAGRLDRLRVRRAARRACTSTTATCARWPSTSPRGSTARSSSTRPSRARTRTSW